jgi:hypothetical protein
VKFDLHVFSRVIISHGAKNTGLNGQSFQNITSIVWVRKMVNGFYKMGEMGGGTGSSYYLCIRDGVKTPTLLYRVRKAGL